MIVASRHRVKYDIEAALSLEVLLQASLGFDPQPTWYMIEVDETNLHPAACARLQHPVFRASKSNKQDRAGKIHR